MKTVLSHWMSSMKITSRSRISLVREQAGARLLRSTQQHEEMEASGEGIFSVKGER